MRRFAVLVLIVAVAGCASGEKDPPQQANPSTGRDLAIDVGSAGAVLYASGAQGTLRIVNTGACTLSVCDDSQCMLLDPGKDLELPVSGRVTFHVTVVGDGAGKAEAHLVGGGESASVRSE
jgi:hypothetical protein